MIFSGWDRNNSIKVAIMRHLHETSVFGLISQLNRPIMAHDHPSSQLPTCEWVENPQISGHAHDKTTMQPMTTKIPCRKITDPEVQLLLPRRRSWCKGVEEGWIVSTTPWIPETIWVPPRRQCLPAYKTFDHSIQEASSIVPSETKTDFQHETLGFESLCRALHWSPQSKIPFPSRTSPPNSRQ